MTEAVIQVLNFYPLTLFLLIDVLLDTDMESSPTHNSIPGHLRPLYTSAAWALSPVIPVSPLDRLPASLLAFRLLPTPSTGSGLSSWAGSSPTACL